MRILVACFLFMTGASGLEGCIVQIALGLILIFAAGACAFLTLIVLAAFGFAFVIVLMALIGLDIDKTLLRWSLKFFDRMVDTWRDLFRTLTSWCTKNTKGPKEQKSKPAEGKSEKEGNLRPRSDDEE